MKTKVCRKCGEAKPFTEYYRHPEGRDGLNPQCKSCHSVRARSPEAREWHRAYSKTISTEYKTWKSMRQRCMNPRAAAYRYYGARGITICKQWDSYANFLQDMGPKPSPNHQIDRIDNDGDYTPGNCKWATLQENSQHRRSSTLTLEKVVSIRWHYNFAGMTQKEIGQFFGIPRETIRAALRGRTWYNVKLKAM